MRWQLVLIITKMIFFYFLIKNNYKDDTCTNISTYLYWLEYKTTVVIIFDKQLLLSSLTLSSPRLFMHKMFLSLFFILLFCFLLFVFPSNENVDAAQITSHRPRKNWTRKLESRSTSGLIGLTFGKPRQRPNPSSHVT